MPLDPKQVELNRITDVIKNRQYAIVSSSIQGNMLIVQAEKIIPAEQQATRDLEASWITNFLKSFGWQIQRTSYPEGKISIEFVKTVKVQTPG